MIHEVDATLSALLTVADGIGPDTEVAFDAPTREWAARRGTAPCIDAFLYDIREDTARREVAAEAVRDTGHRVVARRPPPRRLRLSYLLTAWTSRPEDEHRLLSALLAALLRHDVVPKPYLRGSLAGQPIPVLLQLALPAGPDRSIADVWNALGGELKPSLDLVVIAPFDPDRVELVPDVVTAPPDVRVAPAGSVPRQPRDVTAPAGGAAFAVDAAGVADPAGAGGAGDPAARPAEAGPGPGQPVTHRGRGRILES